MCNPLQFQASRFGRAPMGRHHPTPASRIRSHPVSVGRRERRARASGKWRQVSWDEGSTKHRRARIRKAIGVENPRARIMYSRRPPRRGRIRQPPGVSASGGIDGHNSPHPTSAVRPPGLGTLPLEQQPTGRRRLRQRADNPACFVVRISNRPLRLKDTTRSDRRGPGRRADADRPSIRGSRTPLPKQTLDACLPRHGGGAAPPRDGAVLVSTRISYAKRVSS